MLTGIILSYVQNSRVTVQALLLSFPLLLRENAYIPLSHQYSFIN